MATLAAPNTGFDVDAILNNKQMSIKSVIAHANARYAIKDYNAAAELYSRATELQAEGNGEMSTKNADLLYLYGRCLYHVAVGNSDVLGSKVAGPKRDEEKPTPKPKRRKLNGDESIAVPVSNDAPDNSKRVAGESILQTAQAKKEDDAPSTAKPYFQFTGDENFDDSEDELAGDNPEVVAEEEEPDDDFSNAYEVLDLARLLLQRRLIEAEAEIEAEERQGNGEATALDTSTSDSIKQLKERLADTHDLQAEISLEGERFPAAVIDLRAALAIKQELFPQDSSILAEAHYKLSLALEFSSVTQQVMEGDNSTMLSEKQQAGHVDEVLREEAAKEMEAAIVSCKLRIEKEEMSLNAPANAALIENAEGKRPKITRESIDDVIDMVKDMEQRVLSSLFSLHNLSSYTFPHSIHHRPKEITDISFPAYRTARTSRFCK